MNTPARVSPLMDIHAARAASWVELEDMRSVAAFAGESAAHLQTVAIGDLSHHRRFGVKGPGAANALASLGITTPARANAWVTSGDALILRLGLTEYLVEDASGDATVRSVSGLPTAPDVYPVPRFDAALVLAGPQAIELFRQTCAVDMTTVSAERGDLVLTSMVGVSVTVAAVPSGSNTVYRVWCDGTYGAYLWETLCEVAQDLGGGPVGTEALLRAGC